jgi:hypothetical protein
LRALATILSEEGHKTIHCLVPRRIDHGAAVAADGDQSGKAQPIKMKSQRIRGEAKFFGDLSGGHAFGPGLDQETEDFQAVFLSKRGQGRHGIDRFHISTIIELMSRGQAKVGQIVPQAKVYPFN